MNDLTQHGVLVYSVWYNGIQTKRQLSAFKCYDDVTHKRTSKSNKLFPITIEHWTQPHTKVTRKNQKKYCKNVMPWTNDGYD